MRNVYYSKFLSGVMVATILAFTAPAVFADDAPKAAVAEKAPAAEVKAPAVAPENDAAGAAMPEAELSPAAASIAESGVKSSAEGEGSVEVPVDPNLSFLQLLFKSIGEMKGAATLSIIAIVIQLLIKALDLPILGNWFSGTKGKTKLLIVGGLSFLLTPITLVSTLGLDWGAALTHTTTLTALMVLINQIWIQFVKKEA